MNIVAQWPFRGLRNSKIAGAIVIAGFILLLPVIVPYALISDLARKRKLRSVILASKCPSCGVALDSESISEAEIRWKENMKETMDKLPLGTRLRMIRDLDAVCGACGAELTYSIKSCNLTVRAQ